MSTPPYLQLEYGTLYLFNGAADLMKHAPPHTCYHAEFGRSRSNGTSLIKEIGPDNLTPRVPPFKVTRAHQRWRFGVAVTRWS